MLAKMSWQHQQVFLHSAFIYSEIRNEFLTAAAKVNSANIANSANNDATNFPNVATFVNSRKNMTKGIARECVSVCVGVRKIRLCKANKAI